MLYVYIYIFVKKGSNDKDTVDIDEETSSIDSTIYQLRIHRHT